MGNNFSSTIPSTATAGIDSYVFNISLGSARFMKTIRCKHKEGSVVVKIFIKPYAELSLKPYINQFNVERDGLLDIPNALPYQRIFETETAVYLIRQYIFTNLYDRISTRPFLDLIEKKWITFQLLRTVADAHANQIYHGDLKAENVLVTSWNWVLLSDFSSFKPTYLPEDNPADFSFFFDTSSRRCCYLAPERFYNSGHEEENTSFENSRKETKLTEAMDIFSLGCVIAELFLEGTPIFSFSQLLSYKRNEYDPTSELEKIEDSAIRDMIKHMIQLDPKERYSAERYLSDWRDLSFPSYFSTFLHQYLASVIDTHVDFLPSTADGSPNDADVRIEKLYNEFDKIAFFLGFYDSDKKKSNRTGKVNNFLPVKYNIPHYDSSSTLSEVTKLESDDEGAVIFLSLICSSIRNAVYPSSKLYALDMLLAISEHLSDDMKLDRLLPYIVSLLSDRVSLVRGSAVKAMTELLSTVETIAPINSNIFPEFIFPHLRRFATDPEIFTRTTYAACIASLSETALRFLELSQSFKTGANNDTDKDMDGSSPYEATYDVALVDLQLYIQEQVTILLIDQESSIKRALLSGITRLCVFFGRQKANDFLLSHMITYLNDQDGMLRGAFFETIVGVGTFVGGKSLEEYILPLMVQSLIDPEEYVVEKVLNSLASLAGLGLFNKIKVWELVGVVAPLICHPNSWISYGAISFIVSCGKVLTVPDVWCFIYPTIRPFLKADIINLTEPELLEAAKPRINRIIFEQVLQWASQSPTFLILDDILLNQLKSSDSASIQPIPVKFSDVDRSNLSKLQQLGMTAEDLEKLLFMREYLLKLSRAKQNLRVKVSANLKNRTEIENGSIMLKNLGITPRTVFLTSPYPEEEQQRADPNKKSTKRNGTSEAGGSRRSSISSQRPYLSTDVPLAKAASDNPIKNTETHDGSPSSLSLHPKAQKRHFSGFQLSNYSETSVNSIPILSTPISRSNSHLPSVASSPVASKSSAATGTHATVVTATLDIPSSEHVLDEHKLEREVDRDSVKSQGAPNTPGTVIGWAKDPKDRTLKPLLEKKSLEAFPRPLNELGPHLSMAIIARNRRAFNKNAENSTIFDCKLEGTLIANLTAHKASVNQVCVAPDHNFFASCSDDGTVKIWDCLRLEKNPTTKPRITYSLQEGKIKCMTFIENTYSIASASDDGTIHIFRVDYQGNNTAPKYGKCQTVRKIVLKDEHVVAIEHFNTEQESLLVYATTKGNIYGFDLRKTQVVWVLRNPTNFGVITSFVIDHHRAWILVGTNRGILTLWDLRFHISLKSWIHPSKTSINRLVIYMGPSSRGRHVLVAAGNNEVSLWDIEKVECKEVFMVRAVDDRRSSKIGSDVLKAQDIPSKESFLKNVLNPGQYGFSAFQENSIRSMISPANTNYILTAGVGKIRYWDIEHPEGSYIVSGLHVGEPKPNFSKLIHNGITFHIETPPRTPSKSKAPRIGNPVSQLQQMLVNNHTDCINDIQLVEVPYTIIVSADREGVIKVFR
ncbi:ARM repeat-containing protein [Basidiobolus meristosporus CBS 931.73]|uniref:non-specific serine/threonine protein kinase n=1 Tax=Basidiobolus meristosporus CBS 931.73 TaxID=1314790 RepID=A0A1Y1YMI3_9FUNG|nr:ARM repeat-containing protein [Basidiobolus meristosporus CBS 931.73]|eukprot:ORX99188.1 ARM repeat-containing protein [Basidiobolus meristosporus CBS 931.73]